MRQATTKTYKMTPTKSGGGHVQIPALVLQWAGMKAPGRVAFRVRGGKITMYDPEKEPA
ncbi:MAG: hypothetical protein PHO67_08490 [Candidatus Omnitrophica bacterium]|nr:hypothetical protein [Candidatus Omnitrophota bacterium]